MADAIVLKSDGRVMRQKLNTLDDYQKAVGGYIETVWIPPTGDREGAIVIVHDEGLLLGLPKNRLAMRLLSGCVGPLAQPIVGDVVVVSKVDDDFGDAPAWIDGWLAHLPADFDERRDGEEDRRGAGRNR